MLDAARRRQSTKVTWARNVMHARFIFVWYGHTGTLPTGQYSTGQAPPWPVVAACGRTDHIDEKATLLSALHGKLRRLSMDLARSRVPILFPRYSVYFLVNAWLAGILLLVVLIVARDPSLLQKH